LLRKISCSVLVHCVRQLLIKEETSALL
jgi:hypothetical protein